MHFMTFNDTHLHCIFLEKICIIIRYCMCEGIPPSHSTTKLEFLCHNQVFLPNKLCDFIAPQCMVNSGIHWS